jgi:hypothetical protein
VRALLGEHGGHLPLGRAVDARIGPALLPAVDVGLGFGQALEAKAAHLELGVLDTRFDFSLTVAVAHATRQRHGAVVGEHVAIERIEIRIVDVGLEHALAQIVEHNDAHRAAEPGQGLLVKLGPRPRARAEGEQPHGLSAVAEYEHEHASATVLAGLRIANHRALPVVDLGLLARGSGDCRVRLVGIAHCP